MTLTAERLRELLDYDPETGIFRWKVSRGTARAGDVAGGFDALGYVQIKCLWCVYKAHRLAFLWMTGRWPEGEIDHRNQIKDDNRWCNLREASRSENQRNYSGASLSKAGYRGVIRNGPGWSARQKIDGIRHHLGTFANPLRAAWERELFLHRVGDQFAIRSFPEWWETHAEEDCYDEVRESMPLAY